MTIINPEGDSRLTYNVTGRDVSVRLDNGSLVDRFSLPEDIADDDATLWLLARHHDTMILGGLFDGRLRLPKQLGRSSVPRWK